MQLLLLERDCSFVSGLLIVGLVWNFVCGMYDGWGVIDAKLKVMSESFLILYKLEIYKGLLPFLMVTVTNSLFSKHTNGSKFVD